MCVHMAASMHVCVCVCACSRAHVSKGVSGLLSLALVTVLALQSSPFCSPSQFSLLNHNQPSNKKEQAPCPC